MSMDIARADRLGGASYFDMKLTYEIGPLQLKDRLDDEGEHLQVLDVRTQEAYARGHIPTAVNLPFEPIERQQGLQYLYHLNKNLPVVVYSDGLYCTLSSQAAYLLARNGYKVKMLVGGWEGWMHYDLPVEPGPKEQLNPLQSVDGPLGREPI